MVRGAKLTWVRVDQGCLGHETRKPTTLMTNIEEIKSLDGMRGAGGAAKWPEDKDQRIKMSRGLAAWAPGLVERLSMVVRRLAEQTTAVRALSAKERRDMEDWKKHCQANHLPYRRDCPVCVEAAGRDRPRRTVECPESYCWSMDLAGPFRKGHDAEVNQPRYFLVSTITIPVDEKGPVVEGLADLRRPEVEAAGGADEAAHGEELEEVVDPWIEERVYDTEKAEVATQGELEEDEKKWKEFAEGRKAMKVQSLTWALPVKSRKTEEIISAAAQALSRIRALQIPVVRVHTDRAKEFTSKVFRRWLHQRELYVTYTAGDEPCGNARIERELGYLKSRVRVLLTAADLPIEYWPAALRHAAEERFRGQLRNLGIPTPPLLQFGAEVLAKKKTWFNRGVDWKFPMCKAKCLGPAGDMSMTSAGYVLELEGGQWIRSTVVVRPSLEQRGEGGEEQGEQAELEEARPVFQVSPHNLPRKGIVGKTAPQHPHVHQPAVHRVQAGGEEQQQQQQLGTEAEIMEHNVEEAELRERKELWWEEAMRMWEHRGLQKVRQEQTSRMLEGGCNPGEIQSMMKVAEEVKILERRMKEDEEVRIRKLEQVAEEEVLQTRVVTLEEVQADLMGWKEAFEKEVNTLKNGPVSKIARQEVERLQREGQVVEILPMKAVATVKPPGKRKGRIVVCGNYAEEKSEDVSVGGICSMALRATIHAAAARRWKIGTVDVKAAFLQAPRRDNGKIAVVKPPMILKQMGLVEQDEWWRVNCAIYGFTESPADWANHRDLEGLRKMAWDQDGQRYEVCATPEAHPWKVRAGGETQGYITVYVDDFLVAAREEVMQRVLEEMGKTWECSPPELVTEEAWTRYCGYEIKAKTGGGFLVRQGGYIRDLLERRNVEGSESTPVPKIEADEDEIDPAKEVIREAQALVGELMWISGRSRPDVAYGIGIMSRLIHRRPGYVCSLAKHLLRYLKSTSDHVMEFHPGMEGLEEVRIFVDASFGPPHEQYRSVQGVAIEYGRSMVTWSSTRQPFVAQSTAEAELISYGEAHQAGESTIALLRILEMPVEKVTLYGDNKAALTLCTSDTGPWRTRHLRVRACRLREVIQKPNSIWQAVHMPGADLVADGLTKALSGQAFAKFCNGMNVKAEGEKAEDPRVQKVEVMADGDRSGEHPWRWMLLAGVAVMRERPILGCALILAFCVVRYKARRDRSEAHQAEHAETVEVGRHEGPRVKMLRGPHSDQKCPERPRLSEEAGAGGRQVGGGPDPGGLVQDRRGQPHSYGEVRTPEARREAAKAITEEVVGEQRPVRPREVPSGSGAGRLGGAGCRIVEAVIGDEDQLPEDWIDEPWEREEFWKPKVTGKDQWALHLWEKGWLVRVHSVKRQKRFQPLHETLPCRPEQLSQKRVTVAWLESDEKYILEDSWTDMWPARHLSKWRGFTFLRRVPRYERDGWDDPIRSYGGFQFV